MGLSLSGCARAVADPTLRPASVVTESEPRLDTPLAKYMLSWRELTVVSHARSLLLRQCLAAAGYDLPVEPLDVELERARVQEISDLSRVFGITDRRAAATNGYWPPTTPVPPDTRGIPNGQLGRCIAAADRRVGWAAGRSPYGIARELLIESRSHLEDRPQAAAAVDRWAQCMAEFGYRVTSPTNDQGDIAAELRARELRERRGVAGPSQHELSLASADISCKERTGFIAVVQPLAEAADRSLEETHRANLTADRRRLTELVHLALRISREASGRRNLGRTSPCPNPAGPADLVVSTSRYPRCLEQRGVAS